MNLRALNSPVLFRPPTEGTARGCSHLRRGRGGTFRVESQRVHRRAIRWVTAIGRAAHVRFLQTIHAPAYLCPHGAAVIVHSDGYATLDVGRSPAVVRRFERLQDARPPKRDHRPDAHISVSLAP